MSKYLDIKNYPLYLAGRIFFFLHLLFYLVLHPNHFKYILKFTGKSDGTFSNIPWFTYGAINWLEKNLRKEMIGFEWGSGGSTIFLSSRIRELTSIEHSREWYTEVSNKLKDAGVTNYNYNLIENDASFLEYSSFINKYPENHFDIVIVDGESRNECIGRAIGKTKPGGSIILDNSERVEYKEGINLLSKWDQVHFYGPGPYNHYFWRTSVFKKPIK